MLRNMLARTGLALALGMVISTGLTAQSEDTSADSGDTYVTLDGYGLGRIMPGSLTDVYVRARTAMVKMKIVEEPARSLGRQIRTLRGKKGSSDVVVRLRYQSVNTTRVEVTAREGGAVWDKGLEQQVLDQIGKR